MFSLLAVITKCYNEICFFLVRSSLGQDRFRMFSLKKAEHLSATLWSSFIMYSWPVLLINSSNSRSSDVPGLNELALYLATMRADQKSGQQLHSQATPFFFISCSEWDWTKILLLVMLNPMGQKWYSCLVHKWLCPSWSGIWLASELKRYEKLMPGLGSKFKWTEFWYSGKVKFRF